MASLDLIECRLSDFCGTLLETGVVQLVVRGYDAGGSGFEPRRSSRNFMPLARPFSECSTIMLQLRIWPFRREAVLLTIVEICSADGADPRP